MGKAPVKGTEARRPERLSAYLLDLRVRKVNFRNKFSFRNFAKRQIEIFFVRPRSSHQRRETGVELSDALGNHVDQNRYTRHTLLGLGKKFEIQRVILLQKRDGAHLKRPVLSRQPFFTFLHIHVVVGMRLCFFLLRNIGDHAFRDEQ